MHKMPPTTVLLSAGLRRWSRHTNSNAQTQLPHCMLAAPLLLPALPLHPLCFSGDSLCFWHLAHAAAPVSQSHASIQSTRIRLQHAFMRHYTMLHTMRCICAWHAHSMHIICTRALRHVMLHAPSPDLTESCFPGACFLAPCRLHGTSPAPRHMGQ